jgi:carboxypeptidase family protein/TonB-dependent receptor-like protein
MSARFPIVGVAFFLAACWSVPPAAAQVSTGGVRGIVHDDTGAVLPGVTVEAQSPARLGTVTAVSDGQGMYRLENLPVGLYTITFTLSGFATIKQEGIRIEVGRSIELDQVLQVSTLNETLTVTGQSPVVDTVHAGTSTNFNKELLENSPTTRNQFFDALAYAPAVKSTNQSIGSSSGFVIFGSQSSQNAFQYDGLDVSAPSFGGPYDWPNYDMMAELQVKSVGASAEQAGFQGGVVNLVLKSGSNTFKGSGSYYGLFSGLYGNNTPNAQYPAHVKHNNDFNFTFGGPIQKDRLWFQYINENIRRLQTPVGVPPNLAQPVKIWRPYIKINARLSTADDVSVSYNDCRDWWSYGANLTTRPEAGGVEIGKDPVVIARWTHTFGSATMLEVAGGGVYVRKTNTAVSGDLDTPGHVDLGTGITSVNWPFANMSDHQNKTNINAKMSHTATDFLKGTHEFKFGVQTAPWNTAIARGSYASGTKYYDLSGKPYYIVVQEPYARGAKVPTAGAFAQDDWTVNNRVVLNLGVRYDHTTGSVPGIEQLNAHLEPTGKTFDGISKLISWNNVSPRLGLTMKIDKAGKTVGKISWGRYYGKLIAPMFNNISPGNTQINALYFNGATGKYDIPGGVFFNPKANYGIDPNLENQWTDQLYIGIERQLQPDFGVNVYFVYKNDGGFIRLNDVQGVYAAQPFADTFGHQTLTVYNRVSPGSQSLFQVTNRNDLDQEYKTVVVEANKRFSAKWQALASYQWARSLIYAGGGFQSQNFASLSRTGYGRDPNDLVNAFGPSTVESTHSLRATLTYEAPLGIHVGVRYFFDSGRPYGRLVRVPLNQGTRNVLAEPRGTYHLEAANDLRFRFDKDFRLGGSRRLRLAWDLINATNAATPANFGNNSSQSTYGQVLSVVDPRRSLLSARFEF